MRVLLLTATACFAAFVHADNSNLKCGSAVYAPAVETCCGDRVVSRSRTDLLCCMGNVVRNRRGNMECCGPRGFSRIDGDRCVNGEVFSYVSRAKYIAPHDVPPYRRVDPYGVAVHPGKAVHYGRIGNSHHRDTAKVVSDVRRDGYLAQPVISQEVTGYDTLKCRGKTHRLTDPSQFGFYACCGSEVYEWRYYTCVNDKITQIEDAPWPTVLPSYGAYPHYQSDTQSIFDLAYALYGEEDLTKFFGNAAARHGGHRGYGALPYGWVACNNRYYELKPHQKGYQCCGEDLVDAHKFTCKPYATEPRRLDSPPHRAGHHVEYRQQIGYGAPAVHHREVVVNEYARHGPLPYATAALAPPKHYVPTAGGPHGRVSVVQPYCTYGEVVGDDEAYGCCRNTLFDKRTHFCCGAYVSEKKAGQLCCDGVMADNESGYISCCGRQPYDIRTQTCTRDKAQNAAKYH